MDDKQKETLIKKIIIIVVLVILTILLSRIGITDNTYNIVENNSNSSSNNVQIVENLIESNDNQNAEENENKEQNSAVETISEEKPKVEEMLAEEAFSINKDLLQVLYIYVGQADCILVQNDGEYMLIDAGNNVDGVEIVKYLKSLGITKIDYLIGTHPHEDHIGGIDDVINNFYIGKIYMPQRSTDLKTYNDIIKALKKKNIRYIAPKIGETFNVGNAKCEVMMIDSEAEKLNNCSIVIELTYGDKKFLFTGDMETLKEGERKWNDIDVLKVGHHGSYSSTSEEFLNQVKPEYAVITSGKDNPYGYPHRETLQKLNKIGAKVYRLDESGTIYISSDGANLDFQKLDVSCDVEEK